MIKISGNGSGGSLSKFTSTFTFTGSNAATQFIINHNLNSFQPRVVIHYQDGPSKIQMVDAFQDGGFNSYGFFVTGITLNQCTVNTLRAVGGSNPLGTFNATIEVLVA